MFRFQPNAPFDLTQYTPPEPEDRSGPPLGDGIILTMVSMVASEHCDPEVLDVLNRIDPAAWYHGQNFETIVNRFEKKDPTLPYSLGRSIYFLFRDAFLKRGLTAPTAVVQALPFIWLQATRGDSGEWRSTILGPGRAHIEAEQPYNCLFEAGAVHGVIDAFDTKDVRVDHGQCMRRGAPFCVFEVSWKE